MGVDSWVSIQGREGKERAENMQQMYIPHVLMTVIVGQGHSNICHCLLVTCTVHSKIPRVLHCSVYVMFVCVQWSYTDFLYKEGEHCWMTIYTCKKSHRIPPETRLWHEVTTWLYSWPCFKSLIIVFNLCSGYAATRASSVGIRRCSTKGLKNT